jgi:hypothetical protein
MAAKMRIDDRVLTVVARLVAAMGRRAEWAPRLAAIGLGTLTLLPVLIVGATPEPSDISFEDLQAGRIPPMTSWFRLEGDLRVAPDGARVVPTYPWVYTLRDGRGTGLAVTVVADLPLATGYTQVTGRTSRARSVEGTAGSIEADVPAEPRRNDPWLLLSLPAIGAIGLTIGLRSGYPVVRRDSPLPGRATPLEPGTSVAAQFSGRIESHVVPLDSMLPCTLAVAGDVDTCDLIVTDRESTRRVAIRRTRLKRRIRICRTSGCTPALEIHAPTCDLILAFADRVDRDRLAASLE